LSNTNLRLLYYSLIHPYIVYGIELWGLAAKKYTGRIERLQKRAARILSNSKYNEPSLPLFKKLSILRLSDLYKLNVSSIGFNHTTGCLPKALSQIFTPNRELHSHSTRHANDLHMHKFKTNLGVRSFAFNVPKLWLTLPDFTKTRFSLKSFKVW